MHKISRRTILAGAAAAVPAALPAIASVDTDADLIALVDQALAKDKEWIEALDAEGAAQCEFDRLMPELPKVLRWSPVDADYFGHMLHKGKFYCDPDCVRKFRDQTTVRYMHPSSRERCDLVIAEYEKYWALEDRLYEETGLRAAADDATRLRTERDALIDEVVATPAASVAGHRAKAKLIYKVCLGEFNCDVCETDTAIFASLIADLVGVPAPAA